MKSTLTFSIDIVLFLYAVFSGPYGNLLLTSVLAPQIIALFKRIWLVYEIPRRGKKHKEYFRKLLILFVLYEGVIIARAEEAATELLQLIRGMPTSQLLVLTGEENFGFDDDDPKDNGLFCEPLIRRGIVFHDDNRNHIQDSNEPGIPNVLVSLRKVDGLLETSVRTDSNGRYEVILPNPSVGIYLLEIQGVPNNHLFSTTDNERVIDLRHCDTSFSFTETLELLVSVTFTATPQPSPTSTLTPSNTATIEPPIIIIVVPTRTPKPTKTLLPTETMVPPTYTSTPTPTETPVPTETTVPPTYTPTPTPAETPVPTETTVTPTYTPTSTPTDTPIPTDTAVPAETIVTPTETPTPTATPIPTETAAPSETLTPTPTVTPTNGGCTPGYWKNHPDAWAVTGYSLSDDFDTVFGVDLFNPDITLEQAIDLGGGGAERSARHGTSALLNAAHLDVYYPLNLAQVIVLVQEGDADTLAAYNESICPLN